MNLALRASVGALVLSSAMPAAASIIFDYNTGILTVDGNTTVGDSVTISFNGHQFPLNSPVIPGLAADLTLVFQGLDGNNYLFDYIVTNTSGHPNPGILTILRFRRHNSRQKCPLKCHGRIHTYRGRRVPRKQTIRILCQGGRGRSLLRQRRRSRPGAKWFGYPDPRVRRPQYSDHVEWPGRKMGGHRSSHSCNWFAVSRCRS